MWVSLSLFDYLFCFLVYCIVYRFIPTLVSVLAKRLAGKSISDMTYLVSSGTLYLNSVYFLYLCQNRTFEDNWRVFYTGQMPLLSPSERSEKLKSLYINTEILLLKF